MFLQSKLKKTKAKSTFYDKNINFPYVFLCFSGVGPAGDQQRVSQPRYCILNFFQFLKFFKFFKIQKPWFSLGFLGFWVPNQWIYNVRAVQKHRKTCTKPKKSRLGPLLEIMIYLVLCRFSMVLDNPGAENSMVWGPKTKKT